MPGEAIDPTLLSRSWTRSHEEDEGDDLVFRPSEGDFPPARGRRSFALAADGTLRQTGPGADDRSVASGGTWSLTGNRLTLNPAGSSPFQYEIVTVEPDRLVVRNAPGESG